MKNELFAALLFEDREYSDMLRYELISLGFEIAKNEKEADLILTEEEFLPYIEAKPAVVFMRDDFEAPSRAEKTIVFPFVFQRKELRKRLKELFSELVLTAAGENIPAPSDNIEILTLPDKKSALVGGETVPLSKTEWKMLSLLTLAAKKGKAVSREELEEAIGHDSEKGGNIVDVYICRLRRKIEFPIGRRLIFTVRGSGYSLMKGTKK